MANDARISNFMKPKARNLILDLLLAAEGQPLSARDAITACALFNITANNVRVALVRLTAEGLVEAAGRGSYRLGPSAVELAGEVGSWRSSEQRVRDWHGGYLAVHSGALGRSDRQALRRRQRALDLLGFRELERGLHVRPDNIEDGIAQVRKRLYSLGLEPSASVFVTTEFDPARAAQIQKLWDLRGLNATYRKLREQLQDWMARSEELEPEVAAREAFLLGGKAIHHVVFDPLLPAPLVDAQARHEFVETVREFDRRGRVIWQNLFRPAPLSTGAAAVAARTTH